MDENVETSKETVAEKDQGAFGEGSNSEEAVEVGKDKQLEHLEANTQQEEAQQKALNSASQVGSQLEAAGERVFESDEETVLEEEGEEDENDQDANERETHTKFRLSQKGLAGDRLRVEHESLVFDTEQLAVFGEHSAVVWTVCKINLGPGTLGIASASSDRTVVVHNLLAETPLVSTCRGHQDVVWSLATIPRPNQADLLLSGSWDASVILWEPIGGDSIAVLRDKSPIYSMITLQCANKSWVAVTGDRAGRVLVWDTENAILSKKLKLHVESVWTLCSVELPNRSTAFCSASDDGTVRQWNPMSGKRLWKGCAAEESENKLKKKLKPKSMRKSHSKEVNCLCQIKVDDSCTLVASGSSDKRVRIWNASSGSLVGTYEGHEGKINHLCPVVLKDGRSCVASSSDDGTIRVIDARTAQLISVCRSNDRSERSPFQVACSIDVGGRQLLVGGCENGVTEVFFPEKGGRSFFRIQDHAMEITSMKFLGNVEGMALLVQSSLDTRVSVRSFEPARLDAA